MIGNDIIDLMLTRQQSNWRRKGFLEKVFTVSEREILNAAENREVCVWLLWSMKEAAYKAHQRKWSLPRRLNWKIQECSSLNWEGQKATGVLKIEGEEYVTTSNLTSEYIHTIAVDQRETSYKDCIYQLPKSRAKFLLKEQLSEVLCIPLTALFLDKTAEGIPYCSFNKTPFPLAFSFSDHGKFSGFCVSLMDS